LLSEHVKRRLTVTFLTAIDNGPKDFGRVVRDTNGQAREIVEVKRNC
jgi:bifunctional N-acetylglucosamine-1-phosphate-uridyltransferase/glucosamine-1-phosphate-acetyltransferase GlmU-like protein